MKRAPGALIKGRLITVEGLDGCGKTTQLSLLAQRLAQVSPPVTTMLTLNPGGTPLGKNLRQLLLNEKQTGLTPAPMAELLLYLADRAQHVTQVIRPALEQQQTVLCDRFTDSTVAYQGYGRGFEVAMIHQMNQWSTGGLVPDCTLLFDGPVAALRARLTGEPDRLESENLAFFERTRQGFLDLARQYPRRIHVIDALQSPEAIAEQVWRLVSPLFAERPL
ncbi:MAG: dTMP kinase [Vampirovibrionales bacterium]|nr:dTMP kinase [Vampirovibrionales bacterium]